MKILYVHGLGSGSNSSTGELLKETFPEYEIICAEMPIIPFEALEHLKNFVKEVEPNLIIGTSLGGFYAMQIAGYKKLLINPALDADNDIKNVIGLGEYDYHCVRIDGVQKYIVDEQMIEDLSVLKNRFYNEWLDMEVKSETFGIFGDSDNLLSHKDLFEKKFRVKNMFIVKNMGHRLSEKDIKFVKPIIKEVLAKKDLFNLY